VQLVIIYATASIVPPQEGQVSASHIIPSPRHPQWGQSFLSITLSCSLLMDCHCLHSI